MWIKHGHEQSFERGEPGIGGYIDKEQSHKTQFELLGGTIASKQVVAPLKISNSIREQLWVEAIENGNFEEAAQYAREADTI